MRVVAWNRSSRAYPGVEFLSLDRRSSDRVRASIEIINPDGNFQKTEENRRLLARADPGKTPTNRPPDRPYLSRGTAPFIHFARSTAISANPAAASTPRI